MEICPAFMIRGYGIAKFFGVVNRLSEDVIFFWSAAFKGYLSVEMRSGNDFHGGVCEVNIVDGEPDGYGFGWCEGPVGCVLVEGDFFAVSGHFVEVMGHARDEVGSEQVFDVVEDAVIDEQVVDTFATAVPPVD